MANGEKNSIFFFLNIELLLYLMNRWLRLNSFLRIFFFFLTLLTENEVHKHPCTRSCDNHTSPRNCFYQFEVEKYLVRSKACYNCPYNVTDCFRPDCITADGWQKVVTVINRKMPGPDIQVNINFFPFNKNALL